MTDALVIAHRFRGPPRSGNGGYVAGAIAEALTGGKQAPAGRHAAEVTLRAPVPLDREMRIERHEGGLDIRDGDVLVAEARRTELDLDVPAPPSYADALAVRDRSPSLDDRFRNPLVAGRGFHPVCFCCGTEPAPEDGMHVYAAPVARPSAVAAAWRPHPSFADEEGHLPPAYVWTALDCPGQVAFLIQGILTGMLGRMTARIERPVKADDDNVVTGWCIGEERRKFFAGTAIFNGSGELCAYARATWIGRRDWIT